MCEWGTTETLRLTIPAGLSHTGAAREADVKIDACIAGLVDALNAGGMPTVQSCCGHGKTKGRIDLADGRTLYLDPVGTRVEHTIDGRLVAIKSGMLDRARLARHAAAEATDERAAAALRGKSRAYLEAADMVECVRRGRRVHRKWTAPVERSLRRRAERR